MSKHKKELTLIDTEIDFLLDMVDTIIKDEMFFTEDYKYNCEHFKQDIEDKIKQV
jgi:hypothetical protein